MNIFLSKRAVKSYRSIEDYLVKNRGLVVANAFEQKVIDFFDLLENFPEMGTVEVSEKNIRGFQLTKQIKVFYRIKNKSKIIVLFFFDVRQNPKKTKLSD